MTCIWRGRWYIGPHSLRGQKFCNHQTFCPKCSYHLTCNILLNCCQIRYLKSYPLHKVWNTSHPVPYNFCSSQDYWHGLVNQEKTKHFRVWFITSISDAGCLNSFSPFNCLLLNFLGGFCFRIIVDFVRFLVVLVMVFHFFVWLFEHLFIGLETTNTWMK